MLDALREQACHPATASQFDDYDASEHGDHTNSK
jgi:hypothetical protein